jgi:hypothetical protein
MVIEEQTVEMKYVNYSEIKKEDADKILHNLVDYDSIIIMNLSFLGRGFKKKVRVY